MYQVLQGAGFIDTWPALRPRADGLTCCNPADLANPSPLFSQVRDYVFARGISRPKIGLFGTIELIGVRPWERLAGPAGPIWPADHAGLWAQFQLASTRGNDF